MSKKMKQTFKITALAAALLAAYGPALAEGPENTVSVGIGNWSNDRPQQGQFDGMRDGKSYGLLDAYLSKRDDATGTWLGLKARNLGLENREIKGEWERQGNIGGSLEYSRIRRDQPYTYNTGVTGIGTTTLTTTPITAGAGTNVEMHTTRDRVTAKFFKNLGVGLNFNVSFKNEDKDGARPWSRGSAAEFAVEPINSTTRQLEAILSYARERLQLSGGYYGTTYDNGNSLVTSRRTTTTYYLSLPMGSKSHQFFLDGGYDFTKTTRGSLKLSYSRATQDEHLPTADIAGLASALAPTNLGGRVDTTVVDVGLNSKPMPKLSLAANWRYRDYADKTPMQQFVFGTTPEYSEPLSYRSNTGKLEATYRLPQSYSLLGGIDHTSQSRSVQTVTLLVPMRTSLDETTYRLQLRKSMSETVNGSVAYLHSKRDGSNYTVPGDAMEDAINPLNISDRKRDKWRAMLDWSPMDKLAFQFAVEDAKDKYSGKVGPYGLQDGTARLYTVDGSYQLSPDWRINAWYSRDETKANEITQQNTTVTKYNGLSETGDSFGLGVRGKVSEKLKMGGDVEQFRSVSKYNQNLTGGTLTAGLVPTPDITNKLLRIKLFAQYAVRKNADLRFNLIHEQWRTDDWTWMMFPASGATPWGFGALDGTTVNAASKQNSTFAGVQYVFKFQ